MKKLFALLAFLAAPGMVFANCDDDARVALALATATAAVTHSPARPVSPTDEQKYAASYERAIKEAKPLVVWVNCFEPNVAAGLSQMIHVQLSRFQNAQSQDVVVGRPDGKGGLLRADVGVSGLSASRIIVASLPVQSCPLGGCQSGNCGIQGGCTNGNCGVFQGCANGSCGVFQGGCSSCQGGSCGVFRGGCRSCGR